MIHEINNGKLSVKIDDFGAQLRSVYSGDTEYLWQGSDKYWKRSAPVLFPFVARLKEERYMLDGSEYRLPKHGFASKEQFSCIDKSDDRATFELVDSEETCAMYPRRFRFTIEYRLEGKKLVITNKIENRDEKTMYFGFGGHPGFNVPLGEGTGFEDWYLEFERECAPTQVLFSESCFVTGEEKPYALEDNIRMRLRHELFDNDAVVLKKSGHRVTLRSDNSDKSVTVSYPGMQYIGFWHCVHSDAPFVCIEPWCTLPDREGGIAVFEEKADMISVLPGGEYENIWFVEIE